MSTRRMYHVVPDAGAWKVRRGDDELSAHRLKEDAVDAGRAAARADQPSELLVHDQDGRIGERSTFQADPYPPRG